MNVRPASRWTPPIQAGVLTGQVRATPNPRARMPLYGYSTQASGQGAQARRMRSRRARWRPAAHTSSINQISAESVPLSHEPACASEELQAERHGVRVRLPLPRDARRAHMRCVAQISGVELADGAYSMDLHARASGFQGLSTQPR